MYEPLIAKRYKRSATLLSSLDSWSGLGSDLKLDRAVWIRTVNASNTREALASWRRTAAQASSLHSAHPKGGPVREDNNGTLYQVYDIPQRRWSNLSKLAESGYLGWDGTCILMSQLAREMQAAEQAGLQLQGPLASQVLMDPAGELLICGQWEASTNKDWAADALTELMKLLAGPEGGKQPTSAMLRSRAAAGRLRTAGQFENIIAADPVSSRKAKRQINLWLTEQKASVSYGRRRAALVGGLVALIASGWLLSTLVTLPSRKVPNLQGASVSEAKQEIGDGGWKAKVIALPSDYQAGQIIKQWPNAGKVLADGRSIKLWVAAPKLDAEVPDTVGLDPETAREVLAAAGLRMSENTVAQGPSNQIQSSLPASGQPVRKGSLVQITVAP